MRSDLQQPATEYKNRHLSAAPLNKRGINYTTHLPVRLPPSLPSCRACLDTVMQNANHKPHVMCHTILTDNISSHFTKSKLKENLCTVLCPRIPPGSCLAVNIYIEHKV